MQLEFAGDAMPQAGIPWNFRLRIWKRLESRDWRKNIFLEIWPGELRYGGRSPALIKIREAVGLYPCPFHIVAVEYVLFQLGKPLEALVLPLRNEDAVALAK